MRCALGLLLCLMPLGAFAFNKGAQKWTATPVVMHLQLGGSGVLLDGSTSWGASAEDALFKWNALVGAVQFSVVRDSTAAITRGNRINNVIFSGTVYGSAWDSRTLAVTLSTYTVSTNAFTETDVIFNNTLNWNSYTGPLRFTTGGARLHDLHRVALHEFGHCLGLNHPDDIGQFVTAVMNSTSSDLDTLQADDIDGVQSIYGAPGATAPTITVQPASQIATVGQSVTFAVTAQGTAPLAYQWRKGSVSLPGATNAAFTLASVATSDAGIYSVLVTNGAGAAVSNNVTLTVNQPVAAPTISTQPLSQTVTAGQAVRFTVTAQGAAPLSYQWRRNGVNLAGGTTTAWVIAGAQPADAGSYTVVVSNSGGSITSNIASLVVTGAAVVPPSIVTPPASQSVVAGQPVTFTVAAQGAAPLGYQWRKNGVTIPGATGTSYTLPNTTAADAGSYTVVITNAGGSITSGAAVLVVLPASVLTNLSVRTTLGPAQNLIVGAVISGGAKDVLVRAAGPALNRFGLSGYPDPRLELYTTSASPLVVNDDWPANLATTFAAVGAFPFGPGSRDAAIVRSLSGSFTVQAKGDGEGTVLVEAYDVAGGKTPRLVNVSARIRVGTGDDILIAGFNLVGSGPKQVLLRAIGPGLRTFGVTGVLADPVLELYNAAGARVAVNDNWAAGLAPVFGSVGAFSLAESSLDAALLATIAPGSYTAQVRGGDGGVGEAVIEIYEVP